MQVVDETGRALSYEYEGDLLATASYPTGGKQTYLYDGSGRIETMDGWDGRDFLSNQYDKQGRVICQTYPDGNTCTIDYDDRHQETWFTFSDTGRWEHYYCDHQDHVLRTERGCGVEARKQIEALQEQTGHRNEETFAAIANLPGISVESYVFDEQGNKIAETDKNGNLHTRQYDPYGLVTREEYANGFVVEHDYDAWHRGCRTTDNNGGKTEY